jgi:hypothetical protein
MRGRLIPMNRGGDFVCGGVRIGDFDEGRDDDGLFRGMIGGMFGDDLQVSVVMACSSLHFAPPIEELREVKLRIALQRVSGDSTLPTVDGFVGVAEPLGQETIVDEGVGVLGRSTKQVLVQRIGVRIAPRNDKGASVGFLLAEISGVDGSGAPHGGEGEIAISSSVLSTGDAGLHRAVIGIEASRALQ